MTTPPFAGEARADDTRAAARPAAVPRILVIGYGNPGRQDDGLGPAVVAALADDCPNVSTIDNYQLVLEDAIEVAAHDIVWFVDAARDGEAPCTVSKLTPAFDFTFSSHLLKPETLLAIAARQFGRCPEAYLLGIRGYAFEFAEGLSDRADANLAVAVAMLRRYISDQSGAMP
jgi:hydrogenase maturation protease